LGIPSVTIAIEGFTTMATAVGEDSGYPNLRVVTYPGVIQTHEPETIRKNVEKGLADEIARVLTTPAEKAEAGVRESDEREVVFKGTLDEVNQHFQKKLWSDGLPIIPPTIKKVEEFLKYTDRSPSEALGVLPPRNGEATVWKVAVNGVMAGCRPEYMPILIAIVEVMADQNYGLEHGGSTPGWEAMIILNGPIRNQLGFNFKDAVQRPGYQANTSIGRFYRLFLRNVAGFLPGTTDKGTFGHMFRAVVPENDEAATEVGWKPLHVQRGFKPEDNVVTITSVRAISDPMATAGEDPKRHLAYIIDWVKRMIEPYEASRQYGETHVLLMTPTVAAILAKGGYSKEAVNRYILEHTVMTARDFEWSMTVGPYQKPGTTICDLVKKGIFPPDWCKSNDPNRMVPLMVPSRTQFLIVVTGDPTRNRSCVYRQNFMQGYATSKKVKLPANWEKLMAELGK
jgi:hypothetical protein